MSSTQLSTICFNGLNIKIPYNEDKWLTCKYNWPMCKKSYTNLKIIKQHAQIKVNTWNDYDNVSYFFHSINNTTSIWSVKIKYS